MDHPTRFLLILLPFLLFLSLGALAGPAEAGELAAFFEEFEARAFEGATDFAIDPCDPPCPGLICCDNHVCVHSILACGFYPLNIDSFRIEGSPRSQMSGLATDGILAAEFGQEARLWFGEIDGDDWRRRGVAPGHYQLVLQEGATIDRALVDVVGQDGNSVARLEGHFWVFSTATDSVETPQWDLERNALTFRKCHDQSCLEMTLELPRIDAASLGN